MASISDEITQKFLDDAPGKALRAAGATKQALKDTKDTAVNTGKKFFSGIVLVFNGGKFTADAVMTRIGNMVANSSGAVEHAKNSISMADLYSAGKVTSLDDTISKEVMKYFNRHCDKCGIKYSVLKESGTDSYYVFFKSRELEAVRTVIQESYKDYLKERRQEQGRDPERQGKAEDKKKDSVREKLKENHEKVQGSEGADRHHNRGERGR